jgi:hypothetical protein
MDYKLLDRARTSSNRGDYVQTLAALSNLLRFKDISFVGDDPLAPYLNKLKKSVHKDRQISGTPVAVQPVPVDRDWSHGREYPENTWLINNGWFMHRTFKGEVDFPYPKNIKPIMVSFHIQDPDVLTDTVVKELKRIEPIGCRDWTTLYRLRDFGIKAFFSGCVTTTVGQILPPASGTSEPKLALVETYLNNLKYTTWKVDKFIQIGDYVRDFSLVEGIEDARQMLTEYVPYKQIVTSRLHCYLPTFDGVPRRLRTDEPRRRAFRGTARSRRGRVQRDPPRHRGQARDHPARHPQWCEREAGARDVGRDLRRRRRRGREVRVDLRAGAAFGHQPSVGTQRV